MIAADLVAISLLAFGLYFTRHGRRDLVVAFLSVNVGALAVSVVLASTSVGLGLGLGLFGVLSIIRLRSSEISQREVAYYFASLALGLISGLTTTLSWVPLALMALIVVALFFTDSPRLLTEHRHTTITLDRAFTDEHQLQLHLEGLLGGAVRSLSIQHMDLVNDTTIVDVRYRVRVNAHQGTGLLEMAR